MLESGNPLLGGSFGHVGSEAFAPFISRRVGGSGIADMRGRSGRRLGPRRALRKNRKSGNAQQHSPYERQSHGNLAESQLALLDEKYTSGKKGINHRGRGGTRRKKKSQSRRLWLSFKAA